jgi:dynein light chain LC8-type
MQWTFQLRAVEPISQVERAFDKKYGPTWHCVVGTSLGSDLPHEMKHLLSFMNRAVAIQLWKSD